MSRPASASAPPKLGPEPQLKTSGPSPERSCVCRTVRIVSKGSVSTSTSIHDSSVNVPRWSSSAFRASASSGSSMR